MVKSCGVQFYKRLTNFCCSAVHCVHPSFLPSIYNNSTYILSYLCWTNDHQPPGGNFVLEGWRLNSDDQLNQWRCEEDK
ncbi:hypothetical protein Pmani_015651 [Petrolisthes manimaculis]|uniref:Uncharacterized protein n=1 Tax=Petrolisthes manimaculis TaxID=1843537 RepID=A0AAE1PRY7_9EUCA|nr:hypothetical protein Pmani_015651 [Petrolisthes manimaculis]